MLTVPSIIYFLYSRLYVKLSEEYHKTLLHLKEKLDKYNYYFSYLLGCVSSKPKKKKKKKKKKSNQIKQTIFDNSLSIHKFEELLKDVGLDYCIQYL